MKNYFNLRKKSKLLLLMLLAVFVGGVSPTWASTTDNGDGTVTEGFDEFNSTYSAGVYTVTMPKDWAFVGTYNYYWTKGTESGQYKTAKPSIGNSLTTNTNIYIVTPELQGDFSFWMRSYSKNYVASIAAYECTYENDELTIGTKIGEITIAKSSSVAAIAKKTISYTGSGRVALLINAAFIDDFIYTPYVETGAIDKPTAFSASNVTYNSARLSWTAGGEETAWQLVYSTDAQVDKDSETPIDITENPYTLTSLSAETTYYAFLRAKSGEDVSSWVSTNFTTAEQYAKPSSLVVTKQGTIATLSWTAAGTESSWEVAYSTDSSADPDNLSATRVNSATHTLTDLTVGNTYYVWVRSKYGNGENEHSGWISSSFTLTYSTPAPTSVDGDGITNVTYGSGAEVVNYNTSKSPYYQNNSAQIGAVTAGSEATVAITFSTGYTYGTVVWVDWNQNYEFEDSEIVYAGECTNVKPNTLNAVFTVPAEQAAGNYRMRICAADSYYDSHKTMATAAGADAAPTSSYCVAQDYTLKVKEAAAYAMSVSETAIAFGTVKNTSTSKTFTIVNDGDNALTGVSVVSSDSEIFTVSETGFDIPAEGSKVITVTFVKGVAGDYSGTITVSQENVTEDKVINVTATYEAPTVATMTLKLGEDAVGTTVAFGNVGKQTTKTFTVTNDGDQTLNVAIESNNTTDFTVAPAVLAVTGHSSETFTVTFLYDENARDAEKTADITITPSNEGIAPVVFAVTGTRIEQWSEDFSGNALPDGWETTSTTYWTFADGVAKSTYSSTNYYLITPSLTVEEGASLSFDVRSVGTWNTLTIEKQLNSGTWTSCKDIASNADFGNDTEIWKTFTIEGLEAGNYKFRFNARNFWLDNFQGFKRNLNDPKMGVYSDEACETAVATSVSKDFGFATETQTAKYYIKNDGTGTMTLSLGDAPAGLTQSLDKTSVAAGEHATLTITMPAANKGYNGGNVVVTATDLGTFTVAVSGVIVDDTKMNLNFASDNIPATWTTNSWSKNASGYVEVGYSGSPVTMQTSNLTAVAGEDLVVIAKQSYTTSSYSFGVKYKKTDAESWSDLIPAANIGTSYVMLHGTIAEAGTYQLQFNGQYTQIQRIYGLSVPQEPVMVVYDGESLAAATYNFSNISDEADAVKTFTVKNEGQAELTGLAAALTGDDADHYSVEVSATTIAVNETATVTVKQLKDNLGSHNATLTISADDPIEDKVITLSGFTYDHTKLFVDFEDNAFPIGWKVGTSWTVTTPYNSTAHHAQQNSYNAASALITTPLTVGENEKLTFDAARLYSNSAPELKVRYTTNGGITWSEYVDFASQVTSGNYVKIELTGVPAGTAMVEFYGRYIKIDNIYGFTPTTAPMLALTENAAIVANGDTKAFGNLTEDGVATYTLSNTGTANLVSTVATTGVATVAISGESEGVTISENTVTLAAGKSATITLTLPCEAPYGEKSGAMTITTEGWVGDFTVNYTATTVDPTVLYEDFAGNAKPTGWYQEASGWLFTQGTAHVYTGVDKVIITEKYGAEEGKNVLSFDAKLQSTSADGELKVYTSTNRKDWTLEKTVTLTAENQIVTLDALDDGEYYVKFVSLNASIDNLAGLKKLTAPEHDLFFVSIDTPDGTYVPGSTYTANVTVANLRAESETVTAQLYIKNEVDNELTGQVIALDATKTFTLTGTVPEEGKHLVKVKVFNDDIAVETEEVTITSAHIRTLAIQGFSRNQAEGEPDVLVANEDNQVTAKFDITVKNTGSIAQIPTVKVLNGETVVGEATAEEELDVDGEITLTVTATNMSAGEGGELSFTAVAVSNDGEYAYETPVAITVTAAAPKFALYQNATPVNDGDDVQFGLVKGDDTWKSFEYSIKNEGNAPLVIKDVTVPAGFSYSDGELKNLYLYFYSDGTYDGDVAQFKYESENVVVARNVEVAKQGINFGVHAKDDWTNVYGWSESAVESIGVAVSLAGGKTSADGWLNIPVGTYDVTWNTNDNTIKFDYQGIPAGESMTFWVSLQPKQGKVSGDLVITYKVDANTNKTFTLALSGRSVSADTWVEEFTSGIPATWQSGINNNKWIWDEDNKLAYSQGYPDERTLTTPGLLAQKDDILTYDLSFRYSGYTMKVQYSTDYQTWTDYETLGYEDAGEQSFVAPADGIYFLRFVASRYAELDNFVGFKTVYTLDETIAETVTAETYENLVLKHTFIAGWNTVCLPFDISNIEAVFGTGAKAYDFTSYENDELGFSKVIELEAAKPYLVYVADAITAPIILNNITITVEEASSTTWNGATFRGTYAPIAAPGMQGKYGVTNEAKIAKGSDKASMKGFRAYFELPNGASARLAFTDEDGTTTIINAIELDKQDGEVYNLNGQRVEGMKKGLYIINGKKVVRK